MLDALQDWVGGVALAITTGLGACFAWLVRGHQNHAERMAVLEHQAKQVPDLLKEIRDDVKGMRQDIQHSHHDIYKHIDWVRSEIRNELNGKADKG